MFVLDTNVVSELRKSPTGKANPKVISWARSVPIGSLFLSAITILELELGVLLVERKDATQGRALRQWLNSAVVPAFENRVLTVDIAVARQCAKLHVPNPRSERDALIAATALVHQMTVVTRNVADFEHTGVSVVNPWN